LGYYSLVGKHKNGKQVPVTVISSESRKVIEKRLIYNFKGMGEIAMYNPIGLMCGRIINVNFTSSTYEEILTGKLIHEKFRDVNGDPLPFKASDFNLYPSCKRKR
jgi:hypothetical protein